MWALFINIQRIHILHAVFANIRSKCNFHDKNVGSVHTYICFQCSQILHAEYEYTECLWKFSYSHMRCTLFYENWLDITWEKSISLPWIEHSKKCAPFKKSKWYSHLVYSEVFYDSVKRQQILWSDIIVDVNAVHTCCKHTFSHTEHSSYSSYCLLGRP